jgi:HD-GYP domain-containing protein (c-di-GMP phosphodiesterase class II)
VEQAHAALCAEARFVPAPAEGPPAPGTDALYVPGAPGLTLAQAARSRAMLDLLAVALDAREQVPWGASARVAEHALRLGEALDISESDLVTLERAALLRGLGKMRLSNEVLLKKEVLSYDEWHALQQHARLGAEIAGRTPGLEDLAPAIAAFHENFDGTGYPQGLEGEAIPRAGRILRLVDVFCAMTAPRHYRRGHATVAEGTDHLRAESGTHFDPALVTAFIDHGIGRGLDETAPGNAP